MIYAGVSKLRSTAQQIADGSPIINGSTTIGYVAPIEAVLGKAGANGMYFDGVDDHLTMADSATQAIGTSDFFIFITVGASDWTPGVTECLYSKISGNNGVKLNLTTAGLLQLQIGNGTNFTTYSYSSTTAVPTADYHTAWVGVTVDRDGVATFLWNGSRLGDTVDVSGSVAQSATGASTAYLMRDGSNYHQGRVYGFYLGNYCPDAATCLRYYMYGVPDSDKWASFVPIIDASTLNGGFETAGGGGADVFGSWSEASSGTSTVNDDTLAPYAGTHACRFDMGAADNIVSVYQTPLTTGKRFRVAAYMKCSVAGKIAAYVFGSAVSLSHTLTTSYARYASEAIADATQLTIKRLNAASSSIYVDNVTVEQIGCVICLDGSVPGSVQSTVWLGQSSNAINAAVTGAVTLQNQFLGGGNVATNAALGPGALKSNTAGSSNSAFGWGALSSNTTGSDNAAFGTGALFVNTIGTNNSAFGVNALASNTTATSNSAFGAGALRNNTIGTSNSAFGHAALSANTTGVSNSAFGVNALKANTVGTSNSAFGLGALSANTTGTNNTAFGSNAGLAITTGNSNTFIGVSADGAAAGDSQIAIGRGATTTASNQIAIGSASYKVGFDGANPYATAGASAGYWRPLINGTAYKIEIFADA